MNELRHKLQEEIDTVDWRALRPHLTKDHVILADPGLDLVEVGWSVASDHVAEVAGWIEGGRLRKPSAAELAEWERTLEKPFRVLIVAPYVLIQAA